ncbi:MAG: ribosome-associated translation inhibitor RaiA [Phycisphaerales bacterium]|jgi:putative sigma-54 modulation protein|nr:ribosome-associated translation inhibitor RaiA [Phycisphaerales bacterium]
MQINITSKQLEMTQTIEEYIHSKAAKLTRFYNRIEQINVIVEKTTHGFTAEIITDVEHHEDIVSSNEDSDMHAAIDGCIDRSVRQLTDLKNQVRDHHKHSNGDKQ